MSEPHKRLHTLLTDRAIAGLDAKDRAEFEHLRAGAAIDPTYEAAGAAIDLALLAQIEPLPDAVKHSIIEQAAQHFGFPIDRRAEVKVPAPALVPPPVSAPAPAPARAPAPTPIPIPTPIPTEVEQDFGEDDFGDELVLGEEGSVIRRTWEQSPRSGVIDDSSLETGVLESSLTDGRVDRSATPADSQRNEIIPKLERRSKTGGPRPNRRRTDRQPSSPPLERTPEVTPEPEPEPEPKPKPARKRRPQHVEPSDSDQGSTVVYRAVGEPKLARVATYVSAIAALAMLVIAVWLYVNRGDSLDADAMHDRLSASDDAIEWTFRAEQDEAVQDGAAGSVLWSAELQQGVLLLSGLAINDPAESQYQLWIVDQQREGASVPAVVFDVADEGEAKVGFDPSLVIGEPSAFVITVERPGGVVVSNRDRVAMIATGP